MRKRIQRLSDRARREVQLGQLDQVGQQVLQYIIKYRINIKLKKNDPSTRIPAGPAGPAGPGEPSAPAGPLGPGAPSAPAGPAGPGAPE